MNYSGLTIIDGSFLADTQQNAVNRLADALASAGWTVVSGYNTLSCVVQSGTTPQGRAFRMTLGKYSTNTTNMSLLRIANHNDSVGATAAAQNCGIKIRADLNYHIIASAYQAFVYLEKYPLVQADGLGHFFFGVPCIPDAIAANIAGDVAWATSPFYSGANSTYGLRINGTQICPNYGYYARLLPSFGFLGSAGQLATCAAPYIWVMQGSNFQTEWMHVKSHAEIAPGVLRQLQTPWLSLGAGSNAALEPPALVGSLWDCGISTSTATEVVEETFDGKKWRVLGSGLYVNGYSMESSFWHVVP